MLAFSFIVLKLLIMSRPSFPAPTHVHLTAWARESMSSPYLPADKVPEMVREFEPSYTTEDRFHHNISHLNFMMKTLEQWRKHLNDPATALWATIGHDCFMDFQDFTPGRNEQISTDDTLDRLDGLLEYERLEMIAIFIGATATHNLPSPHSLPPSTIADLSMFLDADNGCVGADPKIYEAYKTGVRQEYLRAGVSAEAYRVGRLSFLRSYNTKSPLFLSVPGQKRFESQAHINMEREITELDAAV